MTGKIGPFELGGFGIYLTHPHIPILHFSWMKNWPKEGSPGP